MRTVLIVMLTWNLAYSNPLPLSSAQSQVFGESCKALLSTPASSIKIVVGLGNKGDFFKETRHNAGYLFLDYLLGQDSPSSEWEFEQIVDVTAEDDREIAEWEEERDVWKTNKIVSIDGRTAKIRQGGEVLVLENPSFAPNHTVILIKPGHDINDSGVIVQALLQGTNFNFKDLVVVSDELNLSVGETTLKSKKSSPNGHMGQKSINLLVGGGEKSFGNFLFKVGIDRPSAESGIKIWDWVLKNFEGSELQTLREITFPAMKTQLADLFAGSS